MKASLIIVLMFCFKLCAAQKNIIITSPDEKLKFICRMEAGKPIYEVFYKEKQLIHNGNLGLQMREADLSKDLIIKRALYKDTTEDYALISGKTSEVHIGYKEAEISFQHKISGKQFVVRIKIFNDGVAFRYELPQEDNRDSFSLINETTTFNVKGDPVVHALFLPGYTTSHEGFYTHENFSKTVQDSLMDLPALFEFPGEIYMAITEAALIDYAGMYLTRHQNSLLSKLSPLPGQTAIKVKSGLPHNSPWRVLLIGDNMGTLIESNIITTLNAPCAINDVSWLKPGKTTFPWWNGNVLPDTINAPGNNFVTAKYYIDFCARNNIEYHSVVEYGLHQWYVDDGTNFQPGPNADVTKPVPGLDMKEICDYANSVGVGVRVWVHWAALYPKLDSAFAIFEKWGLKGMMIDFMDRDDQYMVNMQNEMLEKAARHHLHVQFHGAYKPTGLHRTFPNEFTREGTLNYETNKWNNEGLSPDHDIIMPFTRGLAGSTDYHLGGFRAANPENFRAQYTRPLMLGTRCHMLAMYIVLENYLQMVCDFPEAYEGQPGFEFIKEVPTVWDETRVVASKLNEYIIIARRKNNDWYLGGITNNTPRTVTIPFSFLKPLAYKATLYKDDELSDNPNNVIIEKLILSTNDSLRFNIKKGGGFVMNLHSD